MCWIEWEVDPEWRVFAVSAYQVHPEWVGDATLAHDIFQGLSRHSDLREVENQFVC
jgi:hypothetical protein